jgi:hypothetical protein
LLLLGVGFTQSSESKNIRLITIGAGDEFWSAFGHTAIAIDDDVYGFGYFSFADEGLIQSFIDNEMDYDIGVSDLNEEIELAEWQNRTFLIQNIILTEAEEDELIAYLRWHNLPENQSYRYDYFVNNCSTKIRDLLNDLWDGEIKQKFNTLSNESYFSQTFPAKNQSLMNFGIVLGYGWSAYQRRSAWELMAFPKYFQQKMDGFNQAKISISEVLYVAEKDDNWLVLLKTHGFLLVYFIFFMVLLLLKKTKLFTAKLIWIYQSLFGVIILYFWGFSGHQITSMNFNVLLFSPLAWLALKFNWVKYLLLISYVAWALLALFLQAWYFFPVLVIHVMAATVLLKAKYLYQVK